MLDTTDWTKNSDLTSDATDFTAFKAISAHPPTQPNCVFLSIQRLLQLRICDAIRGGACGAIA
jgi:hypothetical protein